MKKIRVQVAVAKQRDIDCLRKLMQIVEEYIQSGSVTEGEETIAETDDEVIDLIREQYEAGGYAFETVIIGYQTMYANFCDQQSKVLDYKPEIRQALEQQIKTDM